MVASHHTPLPDLELLGGKKLELTYSQTDHKCMPSVSHLAR